MGGAYEQEFFRPHPRLVRPVSAHIALAGAAGQRCGGRSLSCLVGRRDAPADDGRGGRGLFHALYRALADGRRPRGGGRRRRHGGMGGARWEEPTSELKSLMGISNAVYCLKKKKQF